MKKLFFFTICLTLLFSSSALAVTDEEVTAMIQGGEQYLYNNFKTDGVPEGQGYWPNQYGNTSLPDTQAAVAALLETGTYEDPDYAAIIDMAIAYILTFVQADGGIYSSHDIYETGLALVALGLYGQQTVQDEAYRQVIQNAIDYLINGQNENGGWGYNAGDDWTDMSNTQFAVMGLYYGSRYLGLPIAGTEWAQKLYSFLQAMQTEDGHFHYSTGYDYTNESMTGAGIWCLAMIEKGSSAEAAAAVDWFDANYTWVLGSSNNDYYFVYAMAKGLAAAIGPNATVGEHLWLEDLKQVLYDKKTDVDEGVVRWQDNHWLSAYPNLTTAFVLMSLVFADPNVEGPQKFLPENPDTDTPEPNRGTVTLETTGGVTIKTPGRVNIGQAGKDEKVELPIGGFTFKLLHVPAGGEAVLTITPPAPALDPANPQGFLNADGTIKDGLSWFKIQSGAWKGMANVPIKLIPEDGPPYTQIQVTLRDGGPEDEDGTVNGQILDPGAPGVGADTVTISDEDGVCFIRTIFSR